MKKILFVLIISVFCINIVVGQNLQTTNTLLAAAYKKAGAEKKNVFIIFHASWCGWCKKLDASMADSTVQKYFNDSYIFVHLTVQETPNNKKLETPGAAELLATYKGEKAGLPFFLIQDKNGKLLGDSFSKEGNTGCPSNEMEVDYFVSLLKKSSKINAAGLLKIKNRFRQNDVK